MDFSVTPSEFSAQNNPDVRAKIRLHPSWLRCLEQEFAESYMAELRTFLRAEKQRGKVIYPAGSEWFAALDTTPFEAVKVVILGQDPYHGPGQAHGLCFSVPRGVAPPPSLRNILAELEADLGIAAPGHGDLGRWADQGVLLLNTTLTVRGGRAASHQGRGWETFTDEVIRTVDAKTDRVVFVLWGAAARRKHSLISTDRHVIVESAHPSPLSAHNGFFGSRPFSRTNAALVEAGRAPIDWRLDADQPPGAVVHATA